ncbi:MAG: hypothetical protein ACOZIN_09135, partial [Myxococcota bacterium]
MTFHEGCLPFPTSDSGISEAAARKLRRAGEWVSVQLVVDLEVRIVFETSKAIEIRVFDAQQRLVRHHRLLRLGGRMLQLDWMEEREYDDVLDAVVRSRSWRLFPTGEIFIGADDRQQSTSGEAVLERQDMTPFVTVAPEFGDYAALLDFRPQLPKPALRVRDTGM